MNPPNNMWRFYGRRVFAPVLVMIVLASIVAVLYTTDAFHFSIREQIDRMQSTIRSYGAWGPAAYLAICVAAIVLLSPATPLLILASVFGVAWGTLYASIGLALGEAAAFLIARYALRPTVERFVRRRPAFARIDDGVRREGWRMVMITRLVPIFPFNLQNYAYGVTGISLFTFLLTSWITTLPSIAAFVFASGAIISGKESPARTVLYIGIGLGLLVLLSGVPRILKRFTRDPQDADRVGMEHQL